MNCPRCHQRLDGEVIGWKVSDNELIYLHGYCYHVIESELNHKPEEQRKEWLQSVLKKLSAA